MASKSSTAPVFGVEPKKIAFITSEDDPSLSKDDQLAIQPLFQLGYQVFPLIWDNPLESAEIFDALIFRSCWNYHRKFSQFLSWVEQLKRLNIPILNPVDISLWRRAPKSLEVQVFGVEPEIIKLLKILSVIKEN